MQTLWKLSNKDACSVWTLSEEGTIKQKISRFAFNSHKSSELEAFVPVSFRLYLLCASQCRFFVKISKDVISRNLNAKSIIYAFCVKGMLSLIFAYVCVWIIYFLTINLCFAFVENVLRGKFLSNVVEVIIALWWRIQVKNRNLSSWWTAVIIILTFNLFMPRRPYNL